MYHPGQFRQWWSCCKDPIRGSAGCRAGTHIEDVQATAMMDALACFPVLAAHGREHVVPETQENIDPQPVIVFEQPGGTLDMGEQMVLVPLALPAASAATAAAEAAPAIVTEHAAEEQTDVPPTTSDGAVGGGGIRTVTVPYVVGVHDSFAAVCMRHKMTEDELVRLNSLRRRHVRSGDVILVYAERSDEASRDELRRQLVRRFRRECHCAAGEALYYLEGCDYDYDEAVQGRRRDFEWEKGLEVRRQVEREAAEAEQVADVTKMDAETTFLLRCLVRCLRVS